MGAAHELVREARTSAGLTQRALAARAGTSAAAINRYERARAVPDLATLERVLGACGFALRLTMERSPFQPIDDAAAQDQPERDRAVVRDAVSPADRDGWVRTPSKRPSR